MEAAVVAAVASDGIQWQVPKLDVASAFEEAVCVEGKQLEAIEWSLFRLICLEHKLHQVAWCTGAWESPLSIDLLWLMLWILPV